MIKTTLYSAALLAAYSLTSSAFAQNPQAMPMHGNMLKQMQNNNNMPMSRPAAKRPVYKARKAPKRPVFTEFPTAEELARMTPPEPMTAEKIKAHFAKRKARVEETIARDRKHAEKYAKDFARFQKHQADQLAKIMAKAEKQREALLNRINKREQQALDNFNQRNASKNAEAKQY